MSKEMTKFGPNKTAKQKYLQTSIIVSLALAIAFFISSVVIITNPNIKSSLERTFSPDYLGDSLSLKSFFAHRSDSEQELSPNDLSPASVKDSLDSSNRLNKSVEPPFVTKTKVTLKSTSPKSNTKVTTSSTSASPPPASDSPEKDSSSSSSSGNSDVDYTYEYDDQGKGDSKKNTSPATIDNTNFSSSSSSSSSSKAKSNHETSSTSGSFVKSTKVVTIDTFTTTTTRVDDTDEVSDVSTVTSDGKIKNEDVGHSSTSPSPSPSLSSSTPSSLVTTTTTTATTTTTTTAAAGSTVDLSIPVSHLPPPTKPSTVVDMSGTLSDAPDRASTSSSDRPLTPSYDESVGGKVNETPAISDTYETYDPNTLKSEIITAIDSESLAPFVKLVGSDVSVDTKFGKIRGIQADVEGKLVNAFLGIPYAEAPVGELRFKRTIKLSKPWNGTLDATKFKPHCPQHFDLELVKKRSPTTNLMTEDCLHLNIWTPAESNDRKLKPVMVWVFGGGFSGGSGNLDEFDGRILTALGDVVVVNFNYRVGSLGFLDLGIPDSPGNQGLYDMKECLLWVKENIRAFGGNPDQLTLVGQSAGAISIGLLMVNDHSSQLFSRAILQSGSPVMLNFFFTRNEESAEKFLKFINCSHSKLANSSNSATMVTTTEFSETTDSATTEEVESDFEKRRQSELQCLKAKSIGEIIQAQKFILDSTAFPFTPEPTEKFLPLMATEALRADLGSKVYKETFKHVKEVLIGTNADEASVILHMEVPEIFSLQEIKLNITTMSQLRDLVTANLSKEFSIEPSAAAIFSSLFFNKGPEVDTTHNLIKKLYQVIGDLAFVCPVNSFVEGLTERGKSVYQYVFDYRSSASPWGKWMGVTHGDEYIFTFGHPIRYPDRYSKEDIEMSRRMVHTWTQFAKTGKVPNQLGKKWPKFTTRKGEYMKLRLKTANIGRHLDSEICTLFKIGLETYGTRRRREAASPATKGPAFSQAIGHEVRRLIESMAKYSLI